MATLQDLGVSAAINSITTIVFLLVFAFLRLQPVNDRVYYPKWYITGVRKARSVNESERKSLLNKYVNLNGKAYLRFLNWIKEALGMPESELIEHAGLDSAAYLRIYLLGLKVFVPIMIVGFLVLVPINATDVNLKKSSKKIYSTDIDRLSISNVQDESLRLWGHLIMTYVFTAWTCYVLYQEFKTVAAMRYSFLMGQRRRPDQFTVLVRQIPSDPDESISVHIEHFFRVNHPDYYLTHQVVYNANKLAKIVGKLEKARNRLDYYDMRYSRNPSQRPVMKMGPLKLWGKRVDCIEFYTEEINKLMEEAAKERKRILEDEKEKLPVAFVSFKARWGAAVCAQTQQSKNPTLWLTEWAPEPRDVYWNNLAIPYMELLMRKVVMLGIVFVLIFFFVIPVAFVQSLANLEGLEKSLKFLRPLIRKKLVKSFVQGFLPGLILKLFLLLLPSVLMIISKLEGHLSKSKLDRVTAGKYYYFMVVNVFFASVLTGSAFQQLKSFLHQSPTDIPTTLGNSIPMKATFFITYIMVDGWSSMAAEILRLVPLLFYHFKNIMFVKTTKDREKAMAPGSISYHTSLPRVELYFLLGIVYAIMTPFILPFLVIYFMFAFIVYRHQVINVYHPQYESAAAFWPHIHNRIIASMLIKQVTLMGVFSIKKAAKSTPFLIGLPILTIMFYIYCKRRFYPAFQKYPLEEAMTKDILDKAKYTTESVGKFLTNAYVHPVLKAELDEEMACKSELEEPQLVAIKRSGTTFAAKSLLKEEL